MGYYRIINGTKWYYRLKPKKNGNKVTKGLFSDMPRHTLTNALIVSLSYLDKMSGNTFRLYTHFKTYLEYGMYYMKLPQHERCFYEIVMGESSQKPHFDIDINNKTDGKTDNINNITIDGNAVIENLIGGIIKVLRDKGVDINIETDVMIFTSHGEKKQSYHVIIDNWCHTNNVEAKAFYHNVLDHVIPEYKKWIDQSVYSPTQQFRIVGSQKIGTTRVKKFKPEWNYKGRTIKHIYPEEPDSPEHEFVMQLESSVIGFTGNCRFLPPFEPRADQIKHYVESEDITANDANEAINLIAAAGKININDPRFPYKFIGVNGPIVMLKRIKPSRCKICQRVHQNENPYLLVIGDEKSVYFCCRRDPTNKKLFLGKLNPDANEGSPEKIQEKEQEKEQEKIEKVKINWTKNVIDRVQKIAKSGSTNDKKFISNDTKIDPKYKKQLIDIYVNSK